MRPNPTRLAPVAAVGALLLAGCGGGSEAGETTTTTTSAPRAKVVRATIAQPSGCFLTVFLSEGVTPVQRQDVEMLLVSNRRVRVIAFVPKTLALRRFARAQPDLARTMSVNPFTDRFEVVPGARIDVYSIITQFASGVDGVTNVRASAPCGIE
jgi:hypothetical protein